MIVKNVILNTKNETEIDTSKAFVNEETKKSCEAIFTAIALSDKSVHILDGVYAYGEISKQHYYITLETKEKIPLMDFIGTTSAKLKNDVDNAVISMFDADHIKCNVNLSDYDVPIAYSIMHPGIMLRLNITEWTGDFEKCLIAFVFGNGE